MKQLYSIEPAAELFFEKANISTLGIYLNFDVEIRNEGILNANSIFLEIYADSKKVKEFDLNDINAGEGKTFAVENALLPSSNVKEIKLNIKYSGKEYDKNNNFAIANSN